MNDEPTPERSAPADPPQAEITAGAASLRAWLPWLAAVGFALFAGFVLAAYLALEAQVGVLREQAVLAEIQGKTLRQQIEAGQIVSAQRLSDLRDALEGSGDLARLRVIPLAPTAGIASPRISVAVLDTDHREGELIFSGLSAPANDRCYQLWLFDSGHTAGESLSVFAIDLASRETRIPFRLSRPFAEDARLKVTLEPRGGSPLPRGPVMMESR